MLHGREGIREIFKRYAQIVLQIGFEVGATSQCQFEVT